jgi:hypothetical protein
MRELFHDSCHPNKSSLEQCSNANRDVCERQMHAAIAPRRAQFIGRYRNRRKTGSRLCMQKAEAGAHFARAKGAQTPVIDLYEQFDVWRGCVGRHAHRHIIHNDAEFAFKINEDIPNAEVILLSGSNPVETMPPLMQFFERRITAAIS